MDDAWWALRMTALGAVITFVILYVGFRAWGML
jgi:hypothetical protein